MIACPTFIFKASHKHILQTAVLYSEQYGVDQVRVLTLEKNRGKGGAVRRVGGE